MTTKRTELIDLLTSQTSRENALSVLQEKIKTGREIKEFAKFLDLPVTGNLTDIKNRIVQTTVGRRLESEAIRDIILND
jgi:predicted transcriptional regulator